MSNDDRVLIRYVPFGVLSKLTNQKLMLLNWLRYCVVILCENSVDLNFKVKWSNCRCFVNLLLKELGGRFPYVKFDVYVLKIDSLMQISRFSRFQVWPHFEVTWWPLGWYLHLTTRFVKRSLIKVWAYSYSSKNTPCDGITTFTALSTANA